MDELRQRVRKAISGPICSIPTPFRQSDDGIDYDAIAQMIDYQIENGYGVIFLTPGNSHYNVLTDEEMLALGKFCIRYTNKRALVCCTEFGHTTKRMIQLTTALAEAGADLFLPFPAGWADSVTPESLEEYYLHCAKVLPLLLIFPAAVPAPSALNVVGNVLKKTDRVMAIKDDCCNAVSRQLTMQYSDQVAIFSGGQKQNFLNIYPYGATGYLSTIGMFRADIARSFYKACVEKDFPTMTHYVRDVDIPYFQLLLKQPGSFDAGIHACMEAFGFGTRYRRAPYRTLNDEEFETLKQELRNLNLLK